MTDTNKMAQYVANWQDEPNERLRRLSRHPFFVTIRMSQAATSLLILTLLGISDLIRLRHIVAEDCDA